MDDLSNQLERIEEKIDDQAKKSWKEKFLLPVLIALLPSLFTLFVALKSMSIQRESTSYQKLEIVNQVVSDFSADRPEKVIVSTDLIKTMVEIDDVVVKKIEKYAATLTKNKLDTAEQQGGEAGAKIRQEVYQTLQASDSEISTKLRESISEKVYYVIAASATSKENAIAFRRQLINTTDFKEAKVFKTSLGHAVSIGQWNFTEAKEQAERFISMPRFHKDYPNAAYLELKKDHWIQVDPAIN